MSKDATPVQAPEIQQKITTERQQTVSVKVKQPGKLKRILIWATIGLTALAFVALVLFAPKASKSLNEIMKKLFAKLDKEVAAADAGAHQAAQNAAAIEGAIHASEGNVNNTAGQLNKPDTVDGADEASDFLHNIGKGGR